MFLRTATGAAVGIPFLESLAPREARAQSMAAPKRLIVIQSYSGQIANQWYPTSTPMGYQLKDTVFPGTPKADGTTYLPARLPGSTKYSWAPLSDFAGGSLSNIFGTSLQPYLSKVNLLRGIDYLCGMSHNGGGYLGNYNSASASEVYSVVQPVPTIDQILAYSSRFYPSAPVQPALHLGTGSPNTFSYTDYGMTGGAIQEASAILDPAAAWDSIFRNFTAPAPRANPNLSLLAAIHGDYARLSSSPRLSAADKQTLDRHVSFLSDVERGLMARPVASCTVPSRPRSIPNGYPWSDVSSIQDLRDTVSLMINVAAAAIMCDATRIVTFNVQKALEDATGTWVASYHNSADVAGDWHQFAHQQDTDPNMRKAFIAISQWIASSVFAAFLQALDVPEGNGRTYLDNSLVIWGNELGYNHYSTDIMTVMAGSAGGALKTGYYVDYIDWSQSYANPIPDWGVLIPGIPHNRWLVTILQAMGLSPQDYERNGISGYGYNQPISTPYNWPGWDMTGLDTPLPGIMV
jgi:hypothetical protein